MSILGLRETSLSYMASQPYAQVHAIITSKSKLHFKDYEMLVWSDFTSRTFSKARVTM